MVSRDIYPRAIARLHRALGVYIALETWRSGAECAVITRKDLLAGLDLKNLHQVRLMDFCWATRSVFPYHQVQFEAPPSKKIAALILSRKEIPAIKRWITREGAIVDRLEQKGVAAVAVRLPKEADLCVSLTLTLHGLIDASELGDCVDLPRASREQSDQ